MDRAQFEAELARDGYTWSERQKGPHGPNEPHSHDFDARLLILDGEISIASNGERRTCRTGDSFSLAAGTPHTEEVGPEGVSYIAGQRART